MQTLVLDLLGQRGLRTLLEVTGSACMVVFLQPRLALVALSLGPGLTLLTRKLAARSAALSREQQARVARVMEFADERLTQVRILTRGTPDASPQSVQGCGM